MDSNLRLINLVYENKVNKLAALKHGSADLKEMMRVFNSLDHEIEQIAILIDKYTKLDNPEKKIVVYNNYPEFNLQSRKISASVYSHVDEIFNLLLNNFKYYVYMDRRNKLFSDLRAVVTDKFSEYNDNNYSDVVKLQQDLKSEIYKFISIASA